jgi:spectrin beta
MYLRDAKQAEVLLNQQENFLSKEEVPVSYTSFDTLRISRHVADWSVENMNPDMIPRLDVSVSQEKNLKR